MRRAAGLAVVVGLFLCAPASAATLTHRQARRAAADYARGGENGTGRVVAGRCRRHSRTAFRCRISYRNVTGPFAETVGSASEWVWVRRRDGVITVRSLLFGTTTERL